MFAYFISFWLFFDWIGMVSFVSQTKDADLVALTYVIRVNHGMYMLGIIETLKGSDSLQSIMVFAESECHENREQLQGNVGDTILVAVDKFSVADTCDMPWYKFVVKPSGGMFATSDCGNNSLLIKNRVARGWITKRCGHIVVNGNEEFVPCGEESELMDYSRLKELILSEQKK
jgi:hypothetical protein